MTDHVTIPFVVAPSYVKSSNSYYALHHYKKPIPYLLKAGCVVKLNSNHACVICVYNNNRNTERVIANVKGDRTIDIEVDSVILVNNIMTNNADGTYRVTYSIEGEHEPLTHVIMGNNDYHDGIDETSSLVFVEGTWIQLLVPQIDLSHLNEMIKDDNNLDTLNDFYTHIIEFYNDLTSTVFSRKYFAKADSGGPGSAYYGRYTMGQSNPSMRAFYLNPTRFNWGCLHEIAHSFDAYFVRNISQVSLREVWTNIMPDYYQYLYFTEEEYLSSGWKYGGRRDAMLAQLKSMCGVVPIQEWDLQQRLVFLTSFFFRLGHKKLMTALFEIMRQQLNAGVFDVFQFKTFNLIMHVFNVHDMDVVYVNQLIGIKDIDTLLTQDIKYNMKNTVNVYDFLIRPNVVNFELTDSDFNVNQNVELTFKNAHPTDMIGAHYSLVMNNNHVHRSTFTNATFQSLSAVSAGCYKFFFTTGNSKRRYRCNTDYIVFDGSSMAPPLIIQPLMKPALIDETFYFNGLGDDLVATLEIKYEENTIRFTPLTSDPHLYFPHEVYYSVNIENLAVFEFMGENNVIEEAFYEFPIRIGQKIILYHREIGRLMSSFNTTSQTNTFTVTDMGLQHDISTNVSTRLIEKILNFCERIASNYPRLIESAHVQNNVYLSTSLLSTFEQNNLLPVLANFLPDTQVTSITLMGSDNSNLLRINEKGGILQIITFDNNTPGVQALFNLLHNQRPIYSLIINDNTVIKASELLYQIQPNDTIHLEMDEPQNKRFIVIDGKLQQPLASAVYYRWRNDTFQNVSNESNINVVTPLLWIIANILIFIFIILLVVYIIVLSSKEQQPAQKFTQPTAPKSTQPTKKIAFRKIIE